MYKKMTLVIATAVMIGLAGHARADLILHYSLDEGSGTIAHDSSGNGHDGVFEGNPTWTAGKIGGALSFSGGGERVVDADAGDYLNGLDAVTVAIWIKSNETNSDRGFIIGEEPDGGDNLLEMRYDSSGANGGGTNVLKMAVVAPNDEQQLETSANRQTTEWQHVAMVWSRNAELQCYIDGELDTPSANDPARDVATSDITMLIIGQGGKDAGQSWNGLIDDVRIYDEALTAERIQGVMLGEGYPYAMGPSPADGSIYKDTWVTLTWTPGDYAVSHDVYFGDDHDGVENATLESEVFRGNQADTFYVAGFPGYAYPDGLAPGTTYYWRIDEVNDADPNSPWKGPVWSFSVPPKIAYDPDPADGAESVATNATLTWTPGFGAKLHTVYLGDDFDTIANATGGIPLGAPSYTPSSLKAAKTYYWRVDEFDGANTYTGDVWSFTTQGAIANPNPADGAVDITQTPTLTWNAGAPAASHEIYLGTDEDAVRNATAASPEYKGTQALGNESYEPGTLAWETTYFWRVDEVNDTNPDSPWKGPVWSFTTAGFAIVEDFESYTDDDVAGQAIWQHWIDGFGVADNGSQVGYLLPPYAEQTIVHGGLQSMPLIYNNTDGVTNSEAALTLTSTRDWTVEGVTELSLWFHGLPASVGSFTEDPVGTYTITAEGADIWNAADEFHYAFKTLSGAGTIDAQVLSVQNTDAWTKAGVMIRETLEPGSNFAAVYITPGNGCRFQARATTDGAATSDTSVATAEQMAITAPYWIRLERSIGGAFRGYYSSDGVDWQSMSWNPQTIIMASDVYIGLALTSHSAGNVCEATFTNVSTTGTVGAQWADQDIGIASNAADPLYVAVSNSSGSPAVVANDDPTAATIDDWTEWRVPLQDFADQGINLGNVDKIAVGLGSKSGMPVVGGMGTVYVDDLRLYRPTETEGQ
ncbi:MAG: hypothetical protein P8Z79_13535 [Sedimentisphaerales bacterium]